jgi:glutamate dehydrogenase (NAD(P)+)
MQQTLETCPHCGEPLTTAYHTVQQAMKDKNVHPRLAAMVVAVARVAEACKLRGWV